MQQELISQAEEDFFVRNELNIPHVNVYRADSTASPEHFKFTRGCGLRNVRVLYTGRIDDEYWGNLPHYTYLMLIPKGIGMRRISNATPRGLNDLTWDINTQATWEWEYNASR